MSTTITHFAGRKLALLDFRQQRVEADFRSSLVRVRENAEAIAMHGGEGYEKGLLLDYFGDIVLNWLSIMRRTTLVNFVGGLYGQGGTILPILVLAPRYFIGEATLGTIFQTNEAFGRIENSLSWIIDVYGQLARLRSVVDRLSNFDRAITAAQTSVEGLVRVQSTDEAIRVSDLDLCLPQGMRLLERLHLSMDPGHSVLLSGPSGSAKSTLFRLISGIWPFARGRIEVPADMFFLPQRTYIPSGPLRCVVAYPRDVTAYTDAEIAQALVDVGLSRLVGHIYTETDWAHCLSIGEQQRLAFARVLLARPAWAFLDEATASVETEVEIALYGLLKQRLPGTTIVSITHHVTALSPFHDIHLTLAAGNLDYCEI